MACSRIGKRVIKHTSPFIALLFIALPFTLKTGGPEVGLEIVYDHKGFSFFLSGGCTTDYVDTHIKINSYQSFPKNISLQALPIHKPHNTDADNATSTALAAAIGIAGGTLLLLTQKEIERRIEDQKIDLYFQHCDKAIEKSNSDFEKIERRLNG
jgi:hypothetical protein